MKESRDILVLFESLNNHEVFTPPNVARPMLDLLPSAIWSDPTIRILDPCAKSGIFLREAFFRFYDGLESVDHHIGHDGITYDLTKNQQRINHILKNMLYGIATSELTGYVSRRTLYGVMEANTDKQLAALESFERSSNFDNWTEDEKYNFIGRNKFNEYFDHKLFCVTDHAGFEAEGNVFYPADEVSRKVIEEDSYEVEDKYYPFIEKQTKHPKILDIQGGIMKFDVIIGNPPYQVSDGGNSRSSVPIYHRFVEQAISLKPKHVIMITPSRWFAGGKGLDRFRESMLKDKQIRTIVDFPNATAIFPGVDVAGGISYFHWEKGSTGKTTFISNGGEGIDISERTLDEFPILIRSNKANTIIRKVQSKHAGESFLSSYVSPRKPFGMPTNYPPQKKGIPCWFIQKHGLKYADPVHVSDPHGLASKWKVLLPIAPIAGQTDFTRPIKFYQSSNIRIAKPGEVCTESWIVGRALNSEDEAKSFKSYLFTKFARFLLLQSVISQHVTRTHFVFVPDMGIYDHVFTDQELAHRFGLTDEEMNFIDSKIQVTG